MTTWTSPTYGLRAPNDDEPVRDGGAAIRTLALDVDTVIAEQAALSNGLYAPPASGGIDTAILQGVLDVAAGLAAADGDPVIRVYLAPGQLYLINDTLTLGDHVLLDLNGSTIMLAGSSNCDMIRSVDFDSLTMTNVLLESEGVPAGFGVVNGRLNGNRASNTSGRGLVFYGRRWRIDDLTIFDTAGDGVYSECGCTAAQASEEDLLESLATGLRIRHAGGHGVLFRGPHDARFDQVFINGCTLEGFRNEAHILDPGEAGGYNGQCDIGFMHCYANGRRGAELEPLAGVMITAPVSISELQSESNGGPGLWVTAYNVRIGDVFAYRNFVDKTAAEWADVSVRIDGTRGSYSRIQVDTEHGGTGLQVNDAQNTIGTVQAWGVNTGGRGIDINASYTAIAAAMVAAFDGEGGVGLNIHNNLAHVNVAGQFTDCATAVTLPATITRSHLDLSGYADDQVGVTGSPTGSGNQLRLIFGGTGTGLTREHVLADSAWNTSHPVIGNYHLWVDAAGRLRITDGPPSSATDGTIVGSQS